MTARLSKAERTYLAEEKRQERDQNAEYLRVIESALGSGNAADAAMYAVDVALSENVPPMLYRLWQEGKIGGGKDLQMAIWGVWVHNKDPLGGLGERAWLRLFKAAGFISGTVDSRIIYADGTVTEQEAKFELVRDQPTQPVEAWRGAPLQSKGRGMSWTLHRACAVQFAERAVLHGDAGVFRAVIPVRAILAVFGDEREQEFVVNPNMLRGRVVLDEALPAQQLRLTPHPLFPDSE